MRDATVSVVIPVYNSEAYIGAALDSVLRQTHPVSEIIVIDDGSQDATEQIVAGYSQIQWIGQNHRGPSAARNSGIRYAQGAWIAFLDSDDLWQPRKIEKQLMALAAYPSSAFSFSTLASFYIRNNTVIANEPYMPNELSAWLAGMSSEQGSVFGDVYQLLLKVNCVHTSSVIARREALSAVGMFDETIRHGEDHDLWLRLARQWPAVYIFEPVAQYRIHPSALSGTGTSRQELFYRSTIEILSKHAQAFPSVETSKVLASSYNNYTAHLLKAQRWKDAKQSAGKSLRAMPTPSGIRLLVEATFPKMYSRAVSLLQRGRVS